MIYFRLLAEPRRMAYIRSFNAPSMLASATTIAKWTSLLSSRSGNILRSAPVCSRICIFVISHKRCVIQVLKVVHNILTVPNLLLQVMLLKRTEEAARQLETTKLMSRGYVLTSIRLKMSL